MPDGGTLLPRGMGSAPGRGLSGSLPPDLLEQVRARVGTLALLLAAAFAFDPLLFYGTRLVAALGGPAPPADPGAIRGFQVVNIAAVLASLTLWRAARSRRIPTSRLHLLGLAYQVVICLTIGVLANWQTYLALGVLPNLTWIPAVVIFFPLLLPGPPRRMLVASILAGAMAPLSVVILQLTGKVGLWGEPDAYFPAIVGSAFAVVFAWMGAKVIYGLGREVAAARELGSYQLEARLGEGGMGEVWRARHRLLARPAAIKLIRTSLAASPDVLRRFEREAQAIAALRSPHTVNLFDFGVASDGAFYYVMELLDGLDADRLVREFGVLPEERVIHLLRQVCHSLSEAESRGLVHRDIKPANVFLCRYGEELDFVKVLDFGIVKTLDEPREGRVDLTRENAIAGSPPFMAPEQAMGEAAVDGRADLYATGCVAYWLLTGTTVFEGDAFLGQLVSHAHATPAPPTSRTENPISEGFEALIMRCLAKAPAGRPQSARELASLLGDLPGADRWTADRAREWWAMASAREAAAFAGPEGRWDPARGPS